MYLRKKIKVSLYKWFLLIWYWYKLFKIRIVFLVWEVYSDNIMIIIEGVVKSKN